MVGDVGVGEMVRSSRALRAVAQARRLRLSTNLLLSHPGLAVGGGIFILLVLLAVFAPVLASQNPLQVFMDERLSPPGGRHWLGTDHLGRDLLSRLLFGARLSMFVGVTVALSASVFGISVGLVGGYSRRLGNLVMRSVDGLLAFPGIILALALVAILGSRLTNVIIALSVTYTPRVARVVHGVVLQLRETEYVLAAEALGARQYWILLHHILPNSMGPVIVQSSFNFATAILAEASLSFLGVGAPPGTPSWGSILSEGRNYMLVAPWITLLPGLFIFVAVLALNVLGDGLRDAIDPRLRGRIGSGVSN